jgi:MoxR-like ATPase
MYGASPRASINMIISARALAFIRGRIYVLPQDVFDMALDVMRHRLVLSYDALSDGVSSDTILKRIIEYIPAPAKPLQSQAEVNAKT